MAEAQVLTFTTKFVATGACITCGIEMIMPEWYYSKRRQDHANFYCLNGHLQHYVVKSEAEKLREELEREKKFHNWTKDRETALRSSNDRLTHQLNGTRGALTKVKKRIAKGVCPACKRTFADLSRHMTCKHPQYGDAE